MDKELVRIRGLLCATAGAIGWGVSGTCSQYLFKDYGLDAAWLTAVRMVAAGFVLLLAALLRHRQQMVEFLRSRQDMIRLIVFSLAGLLFCQFAYLSAIQYSNSGTATVLQTLSVAIIAALTCAKARVLPTAIQAFSILLALAGVFLIATNGDFRGLVLSPKGLFWGLGAAIGATSYSLLSETIVKKWGSLVVCGYGMLFGGSVFFLLTQAWSKPVHLTGTALLVMGVIILIGTVGAFALFLQGVSDLGSVHALLIGCLEPVSATLLSAVWLHSAFSGMDLAGFACILATVFLFTVGNRKRGMQELQQKGLDV